MKLFFIIASLLVWFPLAATAEIYRCESSSGVSYADEPCGEQAQKIEVQDNRIGGSFGQNLPPRPEPVQQPSDNQETAKTASNDSTCRFINSTDLRRYLIKEQVVQGMTKDNVLDAFGRPPETYPTPQETWVYETKYYGALYELTYVYFRDGCVENVAYRKP